MKAFLLQLTSTCFGIGYLVGPAGLQSAPSIEDYGSLPAVSMMTIAPEGDKVAFRKVSAGLDVVLVVSLTDGSLLNRLEIADSKPRQLSFLGSDKLILIASEHRGLVGSNRGYELSTAFAFDLTTGSIKQLLTPGDMIYDSQSGLGTFAGVSEDSQHAYLPAFVPKIESAGQNTIVFTPIRPDLSLMKVNMRNPKRPTVHYRGSSHTKDYLLDNATGTVVEEVFNNDTHTHTFVARRDGDRKEVLRYEVAIPQVSMVGFSPDRQSLVISATTPERDELRFINLESGESAGPFFARADADIDRAIKGLDQVVHGVAYAGFRPSYAFFDPALTERLTQIVDQHPKQSAWLTSWTPDWKHFLVLVEGNGSSGEYLLYSEGQEPRLIARARPSIAPEDVHPIVEYEYAARDGLQIPTLLTVPQSRTASPRDLPAVLLPHGGPSSHDRLEFDWLAQALASRGYLVVQPQFRGSNGFGASHYLAGRGEWGRKMQDDLTDGIEHLVEKGLVDKERVAIVGASYGGYAALAGAAMTPDLYRCAVSINGVADLPRMMSDERSMRGSDHWMVAYWKESMIGEGTRLKALRDISPAHLADNIRSPVLLVHGEDDSIVPFNQSKAMHRALKRARKTAKLVKLKGEDHHLTRSETRIQALQATLAFLEQHLDGRTE